MIETPEPTQDESAEAAFTQTILDHPDDVTARLVFADWLDEHGRSVQAGYLRGIRKSKFMRAVQRYGGHALTPPWLLVQMPPRKRVWRQFDCYKYTGEKPPEPSPRLGPWIKKIQMGWRMPKHIADQGYSAKTEFFQVYVWEWLNVLSPMLESEGERSLVRGLGIWPISR